MLGELHVDQSIAHNGVCMTIEKVFDDSYQITAVEETMNKTSLGELKIGSMVNLERALRLSDRLGGHMVSGHVDATAPMLTRQPIGDFVLFSFQVPAGFGKYIIEKGSIAIDGISLTVNSIDEKAFSVSIIPHTLGVTTLGALRQGSVVNIEVDLIGKYVEKLLSAKDADGGGAQSRINSAFLAEHGFLR